MNFSEALKFLKGGYKISRNKWEKNEQLLINNTFKNEADIIKNSSSWIPNNEDILALDWNLSDNNIICFSCEQQTNEINKIIADYPETNESYYKIFCNKCYDYIQKLPIEEYQDGGYCDMIGDKFFNYKNIKGE